MGTIEQKVRDILKTQFADVEIRFDHEPGERVSGLIISEKFLDMDHEARQRTIWNLLRAHLTPEERRQVLGFLIYTPEEANAYTEAYEDSD
jgi:acid stress-induced BolA-like protein IbaG/YrbA